MATRTAAKRSTKADQDRKQREERAAAEEAAKASESEATAEELAAQKGRPSNESDADESDLAPAEPEGEDSDLPELGAIVTNVPKVARSQSKASVWTDRLNDAAGKLAEAGYPEAAGVAILHCATPKTAANTANNVRRKIREGMLNGLDTTVTFEVIARGRTILTRVSPVQVEEAPEEQSTDDAPAKDAE